MKTNAASGPSGVSLQRLFITVGALSDDGLDGRIGHEYNDGVHEGADADVVGGRATEHRDHLARDNACLQPAIDLVSSQFLALEILHDEFVVAFGSGLDELRARIFDLGSKVAGDIGQRRAFAHVRLHADKIDDALEIAAFTDRNLHRHDRTAEDLTQVVERSSELGILAIHLVDENDTRQLALVQVAPAKLGAYFDARYRIDHDDARIRDRDRAFRLTDEVDEARRVQTR